MRSGSEETRREGSDLAARLRALREAHPEAQITTELVRLDEAVAIVRAAIALPSGGSASAHGTAPAGAHDATELAETRALIRALAMLCIGAEARAAGSVREQAGTREALSSIPSPNVGGGELRPEPAEDAAPAPEPSSAPAAKLDQRPAELSAAERTPAAATVVDDEDPPLEDYSWTAFWNWARKLGYTNKADIEKALDRSITSLSPAQVRDLIREATGAE